MSEDYVAIFEHPVAIDVMPEMMGADLMSTMKHDASKNTKIHLMRIDGQGTETFDTGFFF
jgi:carotenoid cleavage dioxygenase-like enzyme